MFDYRLFIFNPNLGIDLCVQLLLKYNVKFDNFTLFSGCKLSIHMLIARFGYHLVSQFDDLHRSVHFGIFLIFDFQ